MTRTGDPTNPNSPASFGPPYDGIFPGDPISRESALRAITINGARFLRAEAAIGSLEVGKMADLIVLERNYFEVPEEEIGRQRVLLTMVGGEVVFATDNAQSEFGVTPKFPNLSQTDGQLNRRAMGGFDRRDLSREGVAAVSILRRRGQCPHKHHV